MGKRVIRTRNGGRMTEAEYFGKIRSSLRKGFMYWYPMMQALKRVSRPSQSENKRIKTEYQCENCKQWFKRDEVHIDHKIECGSLKSYDDIVPFIKKLTIEDVDMFQVLCKVNCHQHKTNTERKKKKLKNE